MVNVVNENGSAKCTIVGLMVLITFRFNGVDHLSEGLTGANLSETPN